jgi:hypothetical protein
MLDLKPSEMLNHTGPSFKTPNYLAASLGNHEGSVRATLEEATRTNVIGRIWSRDASLWKNEEAHQKIMGAPYTFGILKQAQALGDFQSLLAHGRRAIRVDLGNHVLSGLQRLQELLRAVLSENPGENREPGQATLPDL